MKQQGLPVVSLLFTGDLVELLTENTAEGRVTYPLNRRTSIKDCIEALGVPHTEVGRLSVNNRPVDFSYLLTSGDRVEVMAHAPPIDPLTPTILRPQPLSAIRFLVDANVGKLVPLLRMVGLAAASVDGADDPDIAARAAAEQWILLSRDQDLLKRKAVVFGHLVRSQQPEEQLIEVIALYGLGDKLRPFSRCMACNGELIEVAKEAISDRLEPLTKKYYHTFQRCRRCDKIYWAGSHREKMEPLIAAIRARTCPPAD